MPYSRTTRILAIRHGETAWNVDTRIQGHLDVGLNAAGTRQAELLAEALAEAGEAIEAIYSSDLRRAFDTARAVSSVTGRPVQAEPGLRERHFGVFQGCTPDEVAERHPADVPRWRQRDLDFCPEGGESLRTFNERCIATATRLAAAHPGQTIALVAHGGVLDCFYRAACGVTLQAPRTWVIGNTSVNRLLYTGDTFTLIGWGDMQHLENAVLDESSDGGAMPAGRASLS